MRAYSMDLRERAVLDSDAGIKQRRRETGEMAPRVQQDLLEGRGPACRVKKPWRGVVDLCLREFRVERHRGQHARRGVVEDVEARRRARVCGGRRRPRQR